jgi:hypothetical protein
VGTSSVPLTPRSTVYVHRFGSVVSVRSVTCICSPPIRMLNGRLGGPVFGFSVTVIVVCVASIAVVSVPRLVQDFAPLTLFSRPPAS